ncbi:MAG: hypothetical protein DBY30_07395 [Verrucomicrobia bacterium]|nr:MAG: hypothetical protein DBY30_07395 [Verrucomicrobiota bacterium]
MYCIVFSFFGVCALTARNAGNAAAVAKIDNISLRFILYCDTPQTEKFASLEVFSKKSPRPPRIKVLA